MQDKVVVIVGATGGIGSTLTQKLAEKGTKLVLAARDSSRLANLASSLAKSRSVKNAEYGNCG